MPLYLYQFLYPAEALPGWQHRLWQPRAAAPVLHPARLQTAFGLALSPAPLDCWLGARGSVSGWR